MTACAPPLRSLPPLAHRLPFYYGWVNLVVAALAMVGTLPGRTQGLGLITESVLRDFSLTRSQYAQINLWATLLGSLACIGFGRLIDRFGNRVIMTVVALALGVVVLALSRIETVALFALGVTLTRVLGQSALSVSSLSVTPLWFSRRLAAAMAVYSIVLSVGFMVAFPLVGKLVIGPGWRTAWASVGGALVLGLTPLAWLLVRRSPEACGLEGDSAGPDSSGSADRPVLMEGRLRDAMLTPHFWIFALGSTLYGLVASGIGLFNESILQERGFEASLYHLTLAVTAMAGLVGNFLGGWLAGRIALPRLLTAALGVLAVGLLALPQLRTRGELMGQAVLMGLSGGMVTVLFFLVWARAYGRTHLGQIQGAAQTLTVAGSAVGPLLLASMVSATGSYASAFYSLAAVAALIAVAALFLSWPGRASD